MKSLETLKIQPGVRHPRRWVAVAAAALAGLPILTGCSAGPAVRVVPAGPATVAASEPPATAKRQPAAYPVAFAAGRLTVHKAPGGQSASTVLPRTTSMGTRRVLRVLGTAADGKWLQVSVPARPNNTRGWVRASEVTLRAVRHHIAVDLSERTLVLSKDGVPILSTPIAVGSADNPTPTGKFFVTDKLATRKGGAYGPYAFGLSAWSPTLSEFAGGDGQIGLHGTNQAGSIGRAVSHGCIRVPNSVVSKLAALLPLGVPVDVTA